MGIRNFHFQNISGSRMVILSGHLRGWLRTYNVKSIIFFVKLGGTERISLKRTEEISLKWGRNKLYPS